MADVTAEIKPVFTAAIDVEQALALAERFDAACDRGVLTLTKARQSLRASTAWTCAAVGAAALVSWRDVVLLLFCVSGGLVAYVAWAWSAVQRHRAIVALIRRDIHARNAAIEILRRNAWPEASTLQRALWRARLDALGCAQLRE